MNEVPKPEPTMTTVARYAGNEWAARAARLSTVPMASADVP